MAEWGRPDFHLVDAEAAIIAKNLDILFTSAEMNHFIRAHHTENPDFAKKIPTSFIRLVEYDRAQAAEPSPLSRRSLGEGGAAAYYIALFQHFGYALISADSSHTPYEFSALADYLASLNACFAGNVTFLPWGHIRLLPRI